MKHITTLLILLLLVACVQEMPRAKPATIPQIEIIVPKAEMPEKPQYEPPPTTPEGNIIEIKMDAKRFEFLPSELRAKKGDFVKLTITAQDVDHNFTMPAFNINKELKVGEDAVVEFKADKEGMYTFYCNTPGHKEQGMEGKIIIT